MACIKGASRSATVAFAPASPYLAAGTMAGAVDLSFSSSANLEIFKLDFQSDDAELPVVGECASTERFHRLSWGGNLGSASDEFDLGLIAGGLVDGSVSVWNPLKLISSEGDEDDAFVARLQKLAGPVRGLEFNINSPNMLATGADGGEICIWDLTNPKEPHFFPVLKSSASGSQEEVSFLSWNHKVQHILASTSSNGATVIWDLKRQKPVISFSDSKRRRCSVLQWHPDNATHLIVASDDDNYPSLSAWDVRNTISPIKEFVGHNKGVLAMSWCPSDNSFLLTCAKDNRTICWDTTRAEVVCELPAGTNWNFDVHWYPMIPGVISASSFDGKIGIYNMEACPRLASTEGVLPGTLSSSGSSEVHLRAPKWLKRPVGASFGFGGKLVSFRPSQSTANSEVYMHGVVTELSLVKRSTEFEAAVQNGEKLLLRVLCERKSQESDRSEDDRQTWGFLKVMFEEEGTARTKLLSHLGFSVPIAENDDNLQHELSQEIDKVVSVDERTDTVQTTDGLAERSLPTDNGEDFFNNLQSPKADNSLPPSGEDFVADSSSVSNGGETHENVSEGADSSLDRDITRALVVGDFKAAVSLCVSENRMANALVIAYLGGSSLWESTLDQYLQKSHFSNLKIVSAMVKNDLMKLVNTRPLNSWEETLALLCSLAQGEEWAILCDTLASRLMTANNTLAATLCYICAGNIDKTVEIWSHNLKSDHEGRSYVDILQDLMEKTMIFALATGQKRFSPTLSKLVENYAELLASQGLLTTAMEYLKLLGTDGSSHELSILWNRIALSTEGEEAPKSMPDDLSQAQTQPSYTADQPGLGVADPSQHYYQDKTQQLQSTNMPVSSYEAYQQPFGSSYDGQHQPVQPKQPDYMTTFQPSQSPNIFVPSQVSQTPQPSFVPSPVTTQPAVRHFIPSTPPVLRNVDQYQQPTLGSQLYPQGVLTPSAPSTYLTGTPRPSSFGAAPPSQVGPVPGAKLSHGATSMTAPRGFMPVSSPGFAPGPGVAPGQPSSPIQQAPSQPVAAPPAPPATVQTVDTSKVPAELKPVIATLTRLYHETTEILGGPAAGVAKKREIDDNSKKIGALFAKLNSRDISPNAVSKLSQLCQALDAGDFSSALHIQVLLTTSDWDECNFWLAALKRMIRTKQARLNQG
ncbi:protein transport protein SEC31 homolog B-like isoform X1 [Aristolochia californica]|uniref:protein transport protein SEC31 homolog B-like isoform X1 n=1 Tax=Aristolochia californica TaxID=171875 RepID=UPI0035E1DFBA